MSDTGTEYERDPDDEREVDLSDEPGETPPLPTIDPDERIEAEDDRDVALDDERPA
ncbi:MAG: hypothetical protein ABWX59_12815 [Microbacteriaceae bacterium]